MEYDIQAQKGIVVPSETGQEYHSSTFLLFNLLDLLFLFSFYSKSISLAYQEPQGKKPPKDDKSTGEETQTIK